MPAFILAVVLAFSMLVSSLPNIAPQQDSGSPLQANSAQKPEQSRLGPAQTLVVARSWRTARMTCEGGPAGPTVLEPRPGFVLLGIEVGVRKGDAIINYFSKVEAIMTMDASGSWGPPAGTIISGGEEKGPLTIDSTRATLIDSKSRYYSTVVVAHRMYGRDVTAGYVAGRDSAQAFFGRLALIPAEAPTPPTTPLPGLVLLVYEVPSAQLQFTLKLGDSEPIPIVLTGQPPPQAPPQAQPAAAQHALRRTDTEAALMADQLIEKHLTAIGGRAALEKLESRIATGTTTQSLQGKDIAGQVEMYNKKPNKSRTFYRLDLSALGAGEVTLDQRCDGETAFVSTMQGARGDGTARVPSQVREITGDQLEALLNSTFPTPLLRYKEAGGTVELTGKNKIGARDVCVVKHTPKAGPASTYYFDADNFLLLRVVTKVSVPEMGREVEQASNFENYRDVDGLKIAFAVSVVNAEQSWSITLNKVEHNKPIDEAMFARPPVK